VAEYANDVLVETDWVEQHLGDDSIRIVEVDENPALYADAHIPGAIGFDWKKDLQDQVKRDFLGPEDFGRLFGSRGISNEHTIVLYGDRNNWFAAYTYWYLKYYGHQDVKLMNGPREKWIAEGRPTTTDRPDHSPVTFEAKPGDDSIRALRDQVRDALGDGNVLVDVRSPQEFSGELIAMAGYEQEGAQRGGHIPGAKSIPSCATCTAARACLPASPSSPTAASASARRTAGSCCTSCSARRTCATTTGRGPSGATWSPSRSRRTSPSRRPTPHPKQGRGAAPMAALRRCWTVL
jgi:thiosulfate/3-mercaptopyruvate sulfurtransferase